MMAGLLVDPQTQEVPYKVEPDGTVVDTATGEACGMVDVCGSLGRRRWEQENRRCRWKSLDFQGTLMTFE